MNCYDLCQFPRPPVGDYRCPIDGGVLRDAVRSRVCGHVFGMQCILTYLLKEQEQCPVCSQPLDCSDLEPADAVRKQVNGLPMACRELDRCSWVGPVLEEPHHAHGPTCGVHRVQCPFCHVRVVAGEEFESHKMTCPEAIVICPVCYEDMPRKELHMHVNGLGGRACRISEPMRRQREAAEAAAKEQMEEMERLQRVHDDRERLERMSFHQSMLQSSPAPSLRSSRRGHSSTGHTAGSDKEAAGPSGTATMDDGQGPAAHPNESTVVNKVLDFSSPQPQHSRSGPPNETDPSHHQREDGHEADVPPPPFADGAAVVTELLALREAHDALEMRHYQLQQTVFDLIDYISSKDLGPARATSTATTEQNAASAAPTSSAPASNPIPAAQPKGVSSSTCGRPAGGGAAWQDSAAKKAAMAFVFADMPPGTKAPIQGVPARSGGNAPHTGAKSAPGSPEPSEVPAARPLSSPQSGRTAAVKSSVRLPARPPATSSVASTASSTRSAAVVTNPKVARHAKAAPPAAAKAAVAAAATKAHAAATTPIKYDYKVKTTHPTPTPTPGRSATKGKKENA